MSVSGQSYPKRCLLLILFTLNICLLVFCDQSFSRKSSSGETWAVYFGSSDCPVCEHVQPLLRSLVNDYGLRIRSYDITRPDDYLVFERIESIHGSPGKFSVPMVIVGENILVGEKQIQNNLGRLVQKYVRDSGAPLPYLGDARDETFQANNEDCAECRDKGRPPSVQSELKKLKVIIDRLLESPSQ